MKSFWSNKDDIRHKSTQTEAEQLAVFKEAYEQQLDAMMDREIEAKKMVTAANHRFELSTVRIEMQEKRITDFKNIVAVRQELIEGLEIRNIVILKEAKEKDTQIRTLEYKFDEIKRTLQNKDKVGMERLNSIDRLHIDMRKLESKLKEATKKLQETDIELLKAQHDSSNFAPILQKARDDFEFEKVIVADQRETIKKLKEELE